MHIVNLYELMILEANIIIRNMKYILKQQKNLL
jgi:hypothetical protein